MEKKREEKRRERTKHTIAKEESASGENTLRAKGVRGKQNKKERAE
jgi:hypothetical protein